MKNIFLIGGNGLEAEFESKGFNIYGGPTNKNINYIENYKNSDLFKFEIENEIEACVVGYDENFNLFKITYAGEVINKTGLFFGTNFDTKRGMGRKFIPSSYCFISSIETFTGRKAEIVTKPDPRSLDIIMKDHKIESSEKNRMLMIGDSFRTDIKFANNNKIDSLLVLTGISGPEDLKKMSCDDFPTFILNKI
jgi:4-nitrophenyl phosphatase